VAAFAVLGTTGGAAALGVGPVALNNGPRVDRTPLASSSSVVENHVEPTTSTVPTATVTTTIPSIVPDIEIPTTTLGDDASNESDEPDSSNIPGDGSESASPESSDHSSDAGDSSGPDGSGDNNTATTPAASSDDSSDSPDTAEGATAPVPGPLTKTISEGSATIDIGPNGLVIVDVTPAAGMTFEVKTKPDKIEIQFHDLVSGSELSDLEFRLVNNGITVKVSDPD